MRLLREVVRHRPDYLPANKLGAELLHGRGNTKEALAWNRRSKPKTAAAIGFGGSVDFLGISVASHSVRAGETLDLKYYWRCPAGTDTSRLAVFVHFKKDDSLFQDDHVLLADAEDDLPKYAETAILVEQRIVPVPPDTPPGDYRVIIGLYDRITNRRLRPRTRLPQDGRAVILPVFIKVSK
jgi:hypothetical protein